MTHPKAYGLTITLIAISGVVSFCAIGACVVAIWRMYG